MVDFNYQGGEHQWSTTPIVYYDNLFWGKLPSRIPRDPDGGSTHTPRGRRSEGGFSVKLASWWVDWYLH